MIRPPHIRLPLLLLTLLAAVAPHARAETRTLLVRGRVIGPEGWPVTGLTVAASGSVSARALTDGQGNYALYLPLPTAAEIARAPLSIRLAPVRTGWAFVRAGGRGAAGLAVEIVGPPAKARVRAPDAAFANAVAGALTAKSVSVVFADLDFTGAPSTMEVADAPVEMPAEVAVPVSGVKVSAPARPEPPKPAPRVETPKPARTETPKPARTETPKPVRTETPKPAPRVSTPPPAPAPALSPAARRAHEDSLRAEWWANKARQDSARTVARRADKERRDSVAAARRAARATPKPPRVVVTATPAPPSSSPAAPGAVDPVSAPSASAAPGPSASAAPAPTDSCECVVKGTIEARSDKRIPESLRVTVWLADRPASRDSVELFMGSPRPFEMRAPCGAHRLAIQVEPRLQRYTPGPPEAFQWFTCERIRPSQWRLALNVK